MNKESSLAEQIRLARESLKAWPKWMKEVAHFAGKDTKRTLR